jgi:type VI protein secretion system component VasF
MSLEEDLHEALREVRLSRARYERQATYALWISVGLDVAFLVVLFLWLRGQV